MRYAHFMTWNMAKNIKNMENKIVYLKTYIITILMKLKIKL